MSFGEKMNEKRCSDVGGGQHPIQTMSEIMADIRIILMANDRIRISSDTTEATKSFFTGKPNVNNINIP